MTDSSEGKNLSSFRSHKVWIVACWGLAIVFGIALRLGWMPAIDLPILTWIHNNQVSWLQQVMYVFSISGNWQAYLILLAVLALILIPKKQLRTWFFLTFNTLTTFGMSQLFKLIFHRERPADFFLIEQSGLSYPSGHAMVSVAFYLSAALMLARLYPKGKWKSIILGAVSFLPGLSRLFMGVHYPTDVLMGWLLGVSAAFFWYELWLQPEKEKSIIRLAGKSLFHD
ncbi:MAG: phosphatase PAP2 family protein [Clostridiaceae bacterium]|nr:phosphatase PAP2 family protein [Clostridiaceae bacterium]